MSKSVYIEGGGSDYARMWARWGYQSVSDYKAANVIQFTGGADVSPALYDESEHPYTQANIRRDETCALLFEYARKNSIPMAGICRGGQFLNVANGGKMFQHCDGHAIGGTHAAKIVDTGKIVQVTSTHHQIMRPNRDKGIVLMESEPLGTFKEHMVVEKEWQEKPFINNIPDADDIEAVYYDDTNSLCFQPHPEWCDENSDCVQAYKYFLTNYLGIDV